MIPGEDNLLRLYSFALGLDFLRFDVNETGDDIQEALTRQDLFPEIRGFVSLRVGGVARAIPVSLVERQELCCPALKGSCHVNLLGVYREMNQRTLLEGKDQVGRT